MGFSTSRRQFMALTGAALSPAGAARAADAFAAAFAEPPFEARPSTYWVWLNGYTDRAQLAYEVQEVRKKGFSAAYILEIGTPRSKVVPPGPAYLGPESLAAIGHAVREAGRVGLEVGITNASSWNSGGEWVKPEHASKGLYWSRIEVEGPARLDQALPFPQLPSGAPKKPDGTAAFFTEVAVLALPAARRIPGYDFIFDLTASYTIESLLFHNGGERHGAKDFVVFASESGTETADFREVFRGTLKPSSGPQTFRHPAVRARYLKLRILSGYDPAGRIELAEFGALSPDGRNVVPVLQPDWRRHTGGLLSFTAETGLERASMAQNIYDTRTEGATASWAVEGAMPPQVRDASEVVNLTPRLAVDGRLAWDVPAGRWTIFRFVAANTGEQLKAPSPKSMGLIIDHFDAEAARVHTEHMLDRLRSELGELSKSALKYFYACSYEVRGSMWTPTFLEEFRRRRGYDPVPYLPVLAGAGLTDEDAASRFKIDYRRTVSDLMVDNFYRKTREIVNKAGLKLVAEAGGPGWPLHQVPVDALKAQGALDIARGEFWQGATVWVVKETACAAHIYGKPLVQMEAFTSWRHWMDGPRDLKAIADRAFTDGANHFVWHTMPHSPPEGGKPGWSYHAGTHVGPHDTWWPMAKPFLDYLARCGFLLRQGRFAADVCYYYGERGFNFVPEDARQRWVDPSLGFGFDYDVTNSDVILNRMSVRDGRLVLPDGMRYEILVLPDHPDMDLDLLERLEALVRQGAWISGAKPRRATGLRDYPACDGKVRDLAAKLWGACDGRKVREHRHGEGRVFWGVPLKEILARRGIGPDFAFTPASGKADLDFIHRRTDAGDLYFVRNKQAEWVEARCTFRAGGAAPQVWDPVTGETGFVPPYSALKAGTAVQLKLPPMGSVFVVFRPGFQARPSPAREPASRLEVQGAWEVGFAPGLDAPSSATFEKLASWTEHGNQAIRYFSGSATYRKKLDLPAGAAGSGKPLYLDLGDVRVIARARLNGKDLGIVWTAPFRFDITAAARPGTNDLEVEVINTWANRIIGDQRASGRKYTSINIAWDKKAEVLPSGLLGPVRVLW